MRLLLATIPMALTAANAASASSLVVPEEITAPISRSIIVIGAPDADTLIPLAPRLEGGDAGRAASAGFVNLSASVIAMVDAPQPVAFENVASISDEERKKRMRDTMPMVIRGGILGDAFSRSAPAASGGSSPQPSTQASAPTTDDRRDSSRPSQPGGPEERRSPGPAAPPPPSPPLGKMQ